MQFLSNSALAVLVTLAMSSVSVIASPVEAVTSCHLTCTSMPKPMPFTPPKGWTQPLAKENICAMEKWDVVTPLTPTTKGWYHGHHYQVAQAYSSDSNVGFKVAITEQGKLRIDSIGKDGHGETFAVGFKVDQWTYWYTMTGGSSCKTHQGGLKDSALLDGVIVVHK